MLPILVKLARSCRPPVGCWWVFVFSPVRQMRPLGGLSFGERGRPARNNLRLLTVCGYSLEPFNYDTRANNAPPGLGQTPPPLQFTQLRCTALLCTDGTALYCLAQHCTALHCTTLICTAIHHTALHCTALLGTAVQFCVPAGVGILGSGQRAATGPLERSSM